MFKKLLNRQLLEGAVMCGVSERLISADIRFWIGKTLLDVCLQFFKGHILSFQTDFVADFAHHLYCIKSFDLVTHLRILLSLLDCEFPALNIPSAN